jgi:hypothetical protein
MINSPSAKDFNLPPGVCASQRAARIPGKKASKVAAVAVFREMNSGEKSNK